MQSLPYLPILIKLVTCILKANSYEFPFNSSVKRLNLMFLIPMDHILTAYSSIVRSITIFNVFEYERIL